MDKYVQDGYFPSTTKSINVDVTDLYTTIPRQGVLGAPALSCVRHSKRGKIGTLTIDHMMEIARLILDANCFAYNNKYYRQICGGAMGSTFTQVLVNIIIQDVTKFSPHIRVIQRKNYFICAIDLIV